MAADTSRKVPYEPTRASEFSERGKWENGVLDYILQAKHTSPALTRAQLEKLGTAYCIERRPSGH